MNLLRSLTMNANNFLFSFSLAVSPGQKIQIYIEKNSAGTYRSMIPTLKGCRKAQ